MHALVSRTVKLLPPVELFLLKLDSSLRTVLAKSFSLCNSTTHMPVNLIGYKAGDDMDDLLFHLHFSAFCGPNLLRTKVHTKSIPKPYL